MRKVSVKIFSCKKKNKKNFFTAPFQDFKNVPTYPSVLATQVRGAPVPLGARARVGVRESVHGVDAVRAPRQG